jgi:hypothetical protein
MTEMMSSAAVPAGCLASILRGLSGRRDAEATWPKLYFRDLGVYTSGLLCMAIGVRTRDLRKVYSAYPPLAAGGALVGRADAKDGKQPKAQIPALDGLSLEILPGEISGPTGNGQVCTSLEVQSIRSCRSHGSKLLEVWNHGSVSR